ncbi:hypothetical protein CYLTODRAFT_370203 [Cylindrobasidium torrendii FP15055 ss-10]|uniref:Glycosyltransferase family 61 protein n=1 Tax=Cylindrobasidium torrendii FP15055 ss-10 TaxID=1314674 RepID=A0A0D7BK36_9AGAR|nr:hypothetical protein CYLTODRAFT_370203 [Cylindrobasidium torrendii FP15055 ss-10]
MARNWLAPPDRRELSLIFFSLTVFTLAFNFSNSVRFGASQNALLGRLGFSSSRIIGSDGRRDGSTKDALESLIFGDFPWDNDHVAGHGMDKAHPLDKSNGLSLVVGDHKATWMRPRHVKLGFKRQEANGIMSWGDKMPLTTLKTHKPGYTVLDNVVMHQGTVYIVTNSQEDFPSVDSIVSTRGPAHHDWEIISPIDAHARFGSLGASVHGTSWLVADTTSDNSTFAALQHTYSSLDTSASLPPPQRVIFPHIYAFKGDRIRADVGLHPYTIKAAFPHTNFLFREDWEDFENLDFPYVLERVVVADHRAADENIFTHTPAAGWWAPVRNTMANYFGDAKPKKKVITYLENTDGLKPSAAEHGDLLHALAKLAASQGYEVHVVSADDQETPWKLRMASVVQSSVVLGVAGSHMMDALWMDAQGALVELFPKGSFSRDREVAVRAVGLKYTALDHERVYTAEETLSEPEGSSIQINVNLVVKSVQDVLSR